MGCNCSKPSRPTGFGKRAVLSAPNSSSPAAPPPAPPKPPVPAPAEPTPSEGTTQSFRLDRGPHSMTFGSALERDAALRRLPRT